MSCPACSHFAPDACELCGILADIDRAAVERGETVPTRDCPTTCGEPWCIHAGSHAILEWRGGRFVFHCIFEGCAKHDDWPVLRDAGGPIVLYDMKIFAEDPEYQPAPQPEWCATANA